MVWLQRGILVVTAVVLGFLLPTLFFDDAYITLRYAANIAAGEGFTYNPPERVLGVTTPLFTFLLATAARLGFDLESAALVLGIAGHLFLCLMVLEALRALTPERRGTAAWLPLAGALLCALHQHLALTAVGGMETPLYVGLLLAALVAAARGSARWTGVTLGLALLTRPDALLILPPAAWLLWRASRPEGRPARSLVAAAGFAAALALPWVAFAAWYFGSPIPHSMIAKRVIHPAGPLEILAEFGTFLTEEPILLGAMPLALWGLERRRRAPLSIALAAFFVVYLGACASSGVTPFPWYANPLLPPLVILGMMGLDDLLARLRLDRPFTWGAAMVLVLAFAGRQLVHEARALEAAWDAWEGQYEIAGRWILNDSSPGDKVLVGEVGVIGYLLPGRVILDSSGINSPAVLRLRRGRAEGDPEWTREVIRRLDPDYITTSEEYLNIRALSGEPWFQETYRHVQLPLLEREGQLIFKKN